jgi:uroporphyrinogen decarboxylase
MSTSGERVLQTVNFQTPDRPPKDLGGMRSTSISAFAYPKLVKALGLPLRLPRVEDTGQMPALPNLDVLDAIGIVIVYILDGVTNAVEPPGIWQQYDFKGRLPAPVRWPRRFNAQPDGSIRNGRSKMLSTSYVFDEEHGGKPFNLSDNLPKVNLRLLRRKLKNYPLTDEKIINLKRLALQVRQSPDRAVFLNGGTLQAPIGAGGWNGVAIFPILCLPEPIFVSEVHEIVTQNTLENIQAFLPEIRDNIDIIMLTAPAWGAQSILFASPKIYRFRFLLFYKQLTTEIYKIAPQVKLFIHTWGAVYKLIDSFVERGFDVMNPVHRPAGGRSYHYV